MKVTRFLVRRKFDGKYHYNYRGSNSRWVNDPNKAHLYSHPSHARNSMNQLQCPVGTYDIIFVVFDVSNSYFLDVSNE